MRKRLIRIEVGERRLTSAEFQQLAAVPTAVGWFANIDNPRTRRAYCNKYFLFGGFDRYQLHVPIFLACNLHRIHFSLKAAECVGFVCDQLRRAFILVTHAESDYELGHKIFGYLSPSSCFHRFVIAKVWMGVRGR